MTRIKHICLDFFKFNITSVDIYSIAKSLECIKEIPTGNIKSKEGTLIVILIKENIFVRVYVKNYNI